MISAVNCTAAANGVTRGQSLADVRAALPSLRTHAAEFDRDTEVLVELARWAGRYGAQRNTEGDDGLWIDITGVAHLFAGEAPMLRDLRRRLSHMGFTSRLGVADTPAAAWALARFGGDTDQAMAIAPPGAGHATLAELPVEALRLTIAASTLLKRLGLYRIGQLYGLPRAALAKRFRDLGRGVRGRNCGALADTVVLRLDQALGLITEPRRPLAAVPVRLVRQVFVEPLVSAAGLDAAMATAVAHLSASLAAAGEGVRQLVLTLYRTDGTYADIAVGTSRASRDCRHLIRLLAEKMKSADLDLGFGVDVVTLEGTVIEPLSAEQPALGAKPDGLEGNGAQGLAQLVDRLTNRLGPGQVYRIAPRQSHIPEQADAVMPALTPSLANGSALPRGSPVARPPFLLRSPEPIIVVAEVPEGPPRRFRWRRASHQIVRAEGPERIECAWWQALGNPSSSPAAETRRAVRPRDYYRVEDDCGGRYWVFREGLYDRDREDGPPLWYLHGLFG